MTVTDLLEPCNKSDNVSSSLLQVVSNLLQTCYNKVGTNGANTTCWQLVNRLVTTCLQTCTNLCVFTRVCQMVICPVRETYNHIQIFFLKIVRWLYVRVHVTRRLIWPELTDWTTVVLNLRCMKSRGKFRGKNINCKQHITWFAICPVRAVA